MNLFLFFFKNEIIFLFFFLNCSCSDILRILLKGSFKESKLGLIRLYWKYFRGDSLDEYF